MTSGHYVSIQSFLEVFAVSKTTLVKLIIITNVIFWLVATSPTCVAKVTYILVLAKHILGITALLPPLPVGAITFMRLKK